MFKSFGFAHIYLTVSLSGAQLIFSEAYACVPTVKSSDSGTSRILILTSHKAKYVRKKKDKALRIDHISISAATA